MELNEIENIELKFLEIKDYPELKRTMISAYQSIPMTIGKKSKFELC